MQDAQKRHDVRLQEKAIQFKKEENFKEMKECTFSPRIEVSHQAKKYSEKMGPRQGRAFNQAQDLFAAKRDQKIEKLKKEFEDKDRELGTKTFMSNGSKKIIRDNSRTLNKSNSQTSFLNRNFFRPTAKARQASMSKESRNNRTARDLSASNSYMRDMSGSKISFLNSS
mmetsp:Transcript_39100/g.59631  ORF Transcript_39100/g.59631 Transcript_39100/m.59631 type:complete len:169 (-) Transcript_39100:1627-2133(-)